MYLYIKSAFIYGQGPGVSVRKVMCRDVCIMYTVHACWFVCSRRGPPGWWVWGWLRVTAQCTHLLQLATRTEREEERDDQAISGACCPRWLVEHNSWCHKPNQSSRYNWIFSISPPHLPLLHLPRTRCTFLTSSNSFARFYPPTCSQCVCSFLYIFIF